MAKKSCILIPTTSNGQESKLFKDLLSFTGNRESTKYIWGLTNSKEFMNTLSNIELDSNGEPTLESLNKELDIEGLLDGNISYNNRKLEIGAINEKGEYINHRTVSSIIDRVTEYNINHPELVTSISENEKGYTIDINTKTVENMLVPSQIEFSNDLNNKLRGIMRRVGFDVSTEVMPDGVNGMFNPLNGSRTADNLLSVIQISNNKLGEESFPEEFSHFAIEGLIKHPLVERLLNSVSNVGTIQTILGESFDKYEELYEGDLLKLQKEAAAKILTNHITNNDKSHLPSLVSRIWNYIKGLLSKTSENEIVNAINEANNQAAQLASEIHDESILPLISREDVLNGSTLYNINKDVNKLKDIAEEALEVASKRLKIISSRNKSGKYSEEDLNSIKNLQDLISKKKYTKSSLAFLSDSMVQIELMNKELNKLLTTDLRNDSDLTKIRRVSSVLRNIKEFSDAYDPIIKQMMNMESMQEAKEVDISVEDATQIANKASDIFRIINNVNSRYKSLRFNTVHNFLKLYWGEDKIQDVGKNKGRKITLEMILNMADKDINGLDRWVNSLSDASDPLLSTVDKAVKLSQANRDRILEDFIFAIRATHTKLKNAGYTTDFMYERDIDGKLTGRLISDINFIKYNKDKESYKQELIKQDLPYYQVKSKLEAWDRNHTEVVSVDPKSDRKESLPKKSLYATNNLSKLSIPQREYYDEMIRFKSFLDELLPNRYTNTYNAVQVRNDMIEAVADNITDPKKAAKIVLGNLKDNFIRRSDDVEFGEQVIDGNTKKVLLDFSGKPVQKLPVYYTQQLEDLDRLSTDFTGSIVAYASMAVNYNEMNKVIDVLELTRDLIKDREVQQTSGNSKLIESFKIVNKIFNKAYTKTGANSNIGARIDDYYNAVLYGKRKKDEGTVNVLGNEVDVAKTLDAIKDHSGQLGMGLNTFASLANVIVGKMQMFIDSLGGEYFNLKNSAIAKKNYFSLLPEYLGELNSTKKSNKLALLADRFDSEQEFRNHLAHEGYYQSPISRIFGSANLYVLQNAGEHYLHNRTMLAMLDAYKVKDRRGNTISLYNAFEVEKTLESGKNLGGKLKIKDGVTNLDGSSITDQDIQTLKLKIGKVNQAMHGAFNSEDKGAIHKYALGRWVMQFRQWMPQHYNRRLKGSYYDAQLDQFREGYYRTLGRFSLGLMRDLSKAKFELGTNWDSLSQHEKSNIKKSLAELTIFMSLVIATQLIGSAKDRKGRWAERMLIYQLQRLKLEVGASVPLSPDFVDNIMTLVQSPAVPLKTLNNVIGLVEFWKMFDEIESGRYKGWSEYERNFMQLVPAYGQIRKVLELGDEEYMFNIFLK